MLFYDQRGAGLSERVAEDRLRVADHLADLDTLIAAHSGGSVVLIGHSWGAMLATAYLGHRPDAASRAVLTEPGFLDAEGLAAFETRRTALSGRGLRDPLQQRHCRQLLGQHPAGPIRPGRPGAGLFR